MSAPSVDLARRRFLAGGAGLVVAFSLSGLAFAQDSGGSQLAGSLSDQPYLDSWIGMDGDGRVTIFTGKVELGQGISTALLQVAAEELALAPGQLQLVTADTALTPNEGYTAGSMSMSQSGSAIRNAAANVRALLLAEAARRLGVSVASLKVEQGTVVAADGVSIPYAELAAAVNLHVVAQPDVPLTQSSRFQVMGKSLPRVDIPAKVTGGAAYVQDLRMPGLVHARVVRPPSGGARLLEFDAAPVEAMPGVLKVVRDGSFLGVIAEGEFQAIKAMRALAEAARWQEHAALPDMMDMPAVLRRLAGEVGTVAAEGRESIPEDALRVRAVYSRPYQLHGSIGPSCAVGWFDGDRLTLWSHTQGAYPTRDAIAGMLGMPTDKVRLTHSESAGCYGHNGADDAAADAALLARALPGRPVKVQWTREQEHAWEPYGPAMVMEVDAALDEQGQISHWNYHLWSNTHLTRPGPPGALMPAWHIDKSFSQERPQLDISRSGSGDRNAIPYYQIPNQHIFWHFVPEMPLRVSALRSLGAYANVFALESTMDELAIAAKADPVAFRLRHLQDPRARAVVESAAKNFGWSKPLPPGRGRGFAFARYKNFAAYLAMALEVSVDSTTGRVKVHRVVAAIDSGEAVNPDGIRNQTEGGIIQSLSWTLYEAASFDNTRVTSIDWASYPILRFDSVPESVEVLVMDRPGEPFLGTGEAAQGPAAAALGNAIRHATATRFYDLPLSPSRLRQALTVG